MCSSFRKVNRVVFHVHCSFQRLALPPPRSCSVPGCYCCPGTTICCWHCGGSSVTATAPHLSPSKFQILCSAQVCGFTQYWISHVSGQYGALWVCDQAPYNQIQLFSLLNSEATSSSSFCLFNQQLIHCTSSSSYHLLFCTLELLCVEQTYFSHQQLCSVKIIYLWLFSACYSTDV